MLFLLCLPLVTSAPPADGATRVFDIADDAGVLSTCVAVLAGHHVEHQEARLHVGSNTLSGLPFGCQYRLAVTCTATAARVTAPLAFSTRATALLDAQEESLFVGGFIITRRGYYARYAAAWLSGVLLLLVAALCLLRRHRVECVAWLAEPHEPFLSSLSKLRSKLL